MRNLNIVNNTIYGNGECLYARWSSVTNAVLANNAIYCPGTTAVDASGFSNVQVVIRNNYIEGNLAGASIDNQEFFAGGTAATAFIDPETANLWPQATSALLGKGALAYSPVIDFNNTSRIDPIDVGAYETNGLLTNPGWQIQEGFKGTAGSDTIAPTVSITNPANGSTVARKSTVSITASASDKFGFIVWNSMSMALSSAQIPKHRMVAAGKFQIMAQSKITALTPRRTILPIMLAAQH